MSILRRKVPNHYIPIHRDNINKNDWIILVEAATIVGRSAENEKLRVAQATLERKIVKKYNLLLRAAHYLVMDGYDPRIHALYFCPQLYQFDADNQLVPLQGEEIGKLVVQAVQGGVIEKRPWYDPSEELPAEPIINAPMHQEFDTVVVDKGRANGNRLRLRRSRRCSRGQPRRRSTRYEPLALGNLSIGDL